MSALVAMAMAAKTASLQAMPKRSSWSYEANRNVEDKRMLEDRYQQPSQL